MAYALAITSCPIPAAALRAPAADQAEVRSELESALHDSAAMPPAPEAPAKESGVIALPDLLQANAAGVETTPMITVWDGGQDLREVLTDPARQVVAVFGIPDDTGTVKNLGRPGANDPDVSVRALFERARTEFVPANLKIVYLGNFRPAPEDPSRHPLIPQTTSAPRYDHVEENYERVTRLVGELLRLNPSLVLAVVGGDNGYSYPLFQSFTGRTGMLVLDNHLDARLLQPKPSDPRLAGAHSGTWMTLALTRPNVGANLLSDQIWYLGVDPRAENFDEQQAWLHDHGVGTDRILTVDQVQGWSPSEWTDRIRGIIKVMTTRVDRWRAMIDIDAVDIREAPGRSSITNADGPLIDQAPRGIRNREALVTAYEAGRGGASLLDLMEVAPVLDQEDRTSKLAADLVMEFLRGWNDRRLNEAPRASPPPAAEKLAILNALHEKAARAIYATRGDLFERQYIYAQSGFKAVVQLVEFLRDQGELGSGKTFADLGSADGLVVHLVQAMTGAEVTGFEKDHDLLQRAPALTFQLGQRGVVDPAKVHWIEGDAQEQDLSQFDVLYCYPSLKGGDWAFTPFSFVYRMRPGALLVFAGPRDLGADGKPYPLPNVEEESLGAGVTGYRLLPRTPGGRDAKAEVGSLQRRHELAAEAQRQSVDRLSSIAQWGISTPREQAQRGWNVLSASGGLAQDSISVNVVIAGSREQNQRVAYEAIFHKATGSLQVAMARSDDDELTLISKPDVQKQRILHERAQASIIALIDPDRLDADDQRVVRAGFIDGVQAHEVPLAHSIPPSAIQAVLIPQALADLVEHTLPAAVEKIVVPDQDPMPIETVREVEAKGIQVRVSRRIVLAVPAYAAALAHYLDRHPGQRVVVHGVRLLAPSDCLPLHSEGSATEATLRQPLAGPDAEAPRPSPSPAGRGADAGLGQQPQEFSGADDADAAEGVQNQQVPVTRDEVIDTARDGAFQQDVVLGVSTSSNTVPRPDHETIMLDQSDQSLDLAAGGQHTQGGATQNIDQLAQRFGRERGGELAVQKRVVDAAGSRAAEQGGHKDVRVNDGAEHAGGAQNALGGPSRTSDGSQERTGDVEQIAGAELSPATSTARAVSHDPGEPPAAALPAHSAGSPARPPAAPPLSGTDYQIPASSVESSADEHTAAPMERQAAAGPDAEAPRPSPPPAPEAPAGRDAKGGLEVTEANAEPIRTIHVTDDSN